jgi:hypothetical protein
VPTFIGKWTYQSLLNDPNIDTGFDALEFGRGTLDIQEAAPAIVKGTIGGPGWSLSLHGSFGFGSPMQVRFQGKGTVGGDPWIYDYIGWLVPAWPISDASLLLPDLWRGEAELEKVIATFLKSDVPRRRRGPR